jgi:hypothetical protein
VVLFTQDYLAQEHIAHMVGPTAHVSNIGS